MASVFDNFNHLREKFPPLYINVAHGFLKFLAILVLASYSRKDTSLSTALGALKKFLRITETFNLVILTMNDFEIFYLFFQGWKRTKKALKKTKEKEKKR